MKRVDRFLMGMIGLGMILAAQVSLNGQTTYPGVERRGTRLVFDDQAAFDAVYLQLETDMNAWLESPDVELAPPGGEDCPDDNPVLADFEQTLGFTSLRKTFLLKECDHLNRGGTPEDVPMHHLIDEILAALVAPDHTLQIGTDIFYMPPTGLVFTVRNADEQSLDSLKNGANPYLLNNVEVFENGIGCSADFAVNGGTTETVGFSYLGQPAFGDINFFWEFGDGSVSSLQNPVHTYAAYGTYEVCLTIEVSKPEFCIDRICKTITVGASCQPFFIYSETGQQGGMCFVDNSVINGNIVSWQWQFGDGTTSNQQNPCHVYPCDKTYLASLTITTDENCTGTMALPVIVDSYSCCSFFASDKGNAYYNGENNRIKYWQGHVQLPFLFHRVVALSRNYKLKSNGKWRRARANLRIQLYGNVYVKGAKGCKCKTPINISSVKVGNNKKSLLITKAIGKFFKAKQEDPWGARYFANGVMVKDVLTPVACD